MMFEVPPQIVRIFLFGGEQHNLWCIRQSRERTQKLYCIATNARWSAIKPVSKVSNTHSV